MPSVPSSSAGPATPPGPSGPAVPARVLVTGAGGLLGRELVELLAARRPALAVTAAGREALDVTDPAAVDDAVAGHDLVLNCAGWTAVDAAEQQEPEAFAVNALGPALLARACARTGARLLHVSTDYVFPGTATRPYPEDAAPGPAGAYGRTKLAGEWAVRAELPDRHWIVRTAWLYGRYGPGFVDTMARLERERQTVDVVDDQVGQPTWARDLAVRLDELVHAAAPAGTYHGTAAGSTSWYGLARELFTLLGADPDRVRPVPTSVFPRPAPRPAWSVLGHAGWARAGLEPLRDWRSALAEAVATGAVTQGAGGTTPPAAVPAPNG
jgi:dTDP-4-dehydrorhamnose reductase